MIALIDGDILVYKAGFAVQKTIYKLYVDNEEVLFDDKLTKKRIKEYLKSNRIERGSVRATSSVELEPESHVIQITKTLIKRIIEETKAEDYKIFLTANDKSNYRFKVATIQDYKGNRKAPKPLYYEKIRSYLVNKWKAEEISGQEADDALGISQCISRSNDNNDIDYGNKTIICSIDKDLLMIPGLHYNIDKRIITEVSEFEGYYNFYKQMLMGDVADNIPGIYGIGPKTVEALFETCTTEQELKKITVQQYKIAFPDYTKEQLKARFLEVGQLLWIRRKEGEIWKL